MRSQLALPAVVAIGTSKANFLTIAEVADRLGVATRTVRRWIESDALVVHRVGRVVRIAEGDLQVFLALHRDD